jgi:predicted AlkP superfamily phosphohydrolase/phosphomutase
MEWDLVRRWAGEGKLPTFARFIEEGVRAELSTPAAQLPDTVWSAVYTGSNPAALEKYFYVQYDPATFNLRHVQDDEISRTPFWDYLSDAGITVGVADAPKFRLSARIKGYQITNWGAHATKTARASAPASMLGDVMSRFGRHPVGDCDAVDARPRPLAGLRRRVLDGVAAHGRLFRWLMDERPVDVFFGAFSAPHCIGHHYWHWIDPTHPNHGQPDEYGLADSIEQVYRAIDREVGELVARAGPQARVLLFAAHGMGPVYHATWNLTEILDRLGFGRSASAEAPAEARDRAARANPWRTLKRVMPGRLQYAIKSMLPVRMQDELLFRWYARDRDWSGRKAFSVPNNDSVGAIRVSVKGRDLHGLVEPGEPYRRFCDELAAALAELTDPVTGRPVVSRITLAYREFHGPFLDRIPDVMVLWDSSFPWHAVKSPRFGTLQIATQDARTGSHTPHGFLLGVGPGLPRGEAIEGASVYDIAPTVLEYAGVAIPPDLDGRPLAVRVPA